MDWQATMVRHGSHVMLCSWEGDKERWAEDKPLAYSLAKATRAGPEKCTLITQFLKL